MSEELSELAADVAEHAKYADELGFGGLCVDLPEELRTDTARRLPDLSAKSKPVDATVERFVPESLPVIPKTAPSAPAPRESRSRLLESSRLSAIDGKVRPLTTSGDSGAMEGRTSDETTKPPPIQSTTMTETSTPSTETVDDVRKDIGECTRCELCSGRTQIVHSTGNLGAKLMFVGEAPGADEDLKGEPFVGRAGQLLTKIIEAIGFSRDEVFIGNINRCRPPGNRQPTLAEAEACKPFLLREMAVVKPKVIVVLGNTACQNLLNTKTGITKLRGNFQDYFGVKVMPTFHPAYLLRDPHKKREVWEDMKKVRDYLNTL